MKHCLVAINGRSESSTFEVGNVDCSMPAITIEALQEVKRQWIAAVLLSKGTTVKPENVMITAVILLDL